MEMQEIYSVIEKQGLMKTIADFFGVGAKIRLPLSVNVCNSGIEQLNLSVRSYNGLMRAGLTTVEKVFDYMQKGKLLDIRNLGKNSVAEIRKKAYEFAYGALSEKSKKKFVKGLLELNKN